MSHQGTVYYQSTDRGLESPCGEHAIRYFGQVFRIPRSAHGTLQQLEWEPSPSELRHTIANEYDRPIRPMLRGVIERFEVVDRDSGDVWVMYRVPYRLADAGDSADEGDNHED